MDDALHTQEKILDFINQGFPNVVKLNDLANRKFYLRPTYILKRLAKTKTLEEFKINLRGFFSYSFFHYSH